MPARAGRRGGVQILKQSVQHLCLSLLAVEVAAALRAAFKTGRGIAPNGVARHACRRIARRARITASCGMIIA